MMNNQDMTFCTNCGRQIRRDAKFCNYCRAPVAPTSGGGTTPITNTAATAPPAYPAGAPGTTPLAAAAPGTQTLVAAEPQPALPIIGAAEDITQALSTLQDGFSLLPPGALLGSNQAQYVVQTGQAEQPDVRHIYKAERWPVQAEAGSEPAQFLIMEVQDPILVDRERDLVDKKLPDTGLLLPVAAFKEQLWEENARHYLVYAEKPAADLKPASGLPRPQPLESVLGWGAVLATGLQTLHDKQIAHTQVNPQNIHVDDSDARLTGFENVKTLQKLSRDEQNQLRQRDVADLATSLQDLLGGPRAVLPAEVSGVLQQGQGKQAGQRYPSAAAFGQALGQVLETLQPGDINVREGHGTDDGVVRDHNEDNFVAQEKGALSRKIPLTYGFYIVADGMGGHAAGEDASDLAINAAMATMVEAARTLEQPDSRQMQAIARHACLAANKAVFDERTRRGSDMGTTIVAALRIGDRVAIGNIGDSRAYLVNAREIRPVTVDHSLVQRLIDTGQISPAEARTHPQRNLIYKVVGDKPTVEPDVFTVRMQSGDRLLLCSDGLWEMVEDPVIWQTTLSHQDPQAACDQLIDLANKAGGEDNITVVIILAR